MTENKKEIMQWAAMAFIAGALICFIFSGFLSMAESAAEMAEENKASLLKSDIRTIVYKTVSELCARN